jgi:hypothetical protein
LREEVTMSLRGAVLPLTVLAWAAAALGAVAQNQNNDRLSDMMVPNINDPKQLGLWLEIAGIEPSVPAGAVAPARKWIRLGTDGGAMYFARFEKLDAQPTAAGKLKIERFRPAIHPDGELTRSELTELEFDCPGRNSRIASQTAFVSHNAAGARKRLTSPAGWTPLTAGTIVAQVGAYACQGFNKAGATR